MSSPAFRAPGMLLLILVVAALGLSCRSGTPVEPTAQQFQVDLRTAIPDLLTLEELKAEFARVAVQAARWGCTQTGERLAGEPTRILVSLTQSTVAHRFISPDSGLSQRMGPGFIGSESALVIAVEGLIEPGSEPSNRQAENPGSFVFVEPVGNPEFTACVVREAPLSLNQSDFLYGSFDFEPL